MVAGVREGVRAYRRFEEEHLDECARLLVATFNHEPWSDRYTHDTAKAQLAWHLGVPGCLGLVSVNDGIVAFAIGYREPTDDLVRGCPCLVRPECETAMPI
jgi:hypothetical protein